MDEEQARLAVRELTAFLNDWQERHDLRNSEVRQIVATVLAERFPALKKPV